MCIILDVSSRKSLHRGKGDKTMSNMPPLIKGPLELESYPGLKFTLNPKLEENQPKVDVIKLEFQQIEGDTATVFMTPAEAIQVSIGLQSMVQRYLYNSKEYRSTILVPQNRIATKRDKKSTVPASKSSPKIGGVMKAPEYKRIRRKLKLTQAQMAKVLEVSIKTVQSYEQGRANIPHLVARVMRLMSSHPHVRKRMLEGIKE